jgi:hypothetical protein
MEDPVPGFLFFSHGYRDARLIDEFFSVMSARLPDSRILPRTGDADQISARLAIS